MTMKVQVRCISLNTNIRKLRQAKVVDLKAVYTKMYTINILNTEFNFNFT
jgi:hypothetical protein